MRDPALRASDAERDEVARQLQGHLAEGRISIDEFHERLEALYGARTRRDLDMLLSDLPRPWETAPTPNVLHPDRRAALRAERYRRGWARYAIVVGACWMLWAFFFLVSAGRDLAGYWPVFVTVAWGALRLLRLPALRARPRA